MLIQKQRGTSQ